ncbi:Hyaluronan mediated motility receptor [Orchesella cincta]|uniref:Hyaluronan mediated motility receptor n=1 Tax=Orchesella cincta TaxID=48709 RepID=A0A1D2MBE9_ORCCI|nr:Hyaluronan mediated motility receptor [Orchesella cincta]
MSFSRAPIKRFNEINNGVPSPTKYYVKYPNDIKVCIPPAVKTNYPNLSGRNNPPDINRCKSVPNLKAMDRNRLQRSTSSGSTQDLSLEQTQSSIYCHPRHPNLYLLLRLKRDSVGYISWTKK